MVRQLVIMVLGCSMGGCIVVPIPHDDVVLQKRPGVAVKNDFSFIETGKTTREEVMLRLGEPDYRWRDDRLMVYRWETSNMDLLILPLEGGSISDQPYPVDHYLVVEFDGEDRVVRYGVRQSEMLKQVPVENVESAWVTKEGSAK